MGKQGSLVLHASHTSPPTLWVPLTSLPNTSRLQKLQGVRAREGGWGGGVSAGASESLSHQWDVQGAHPPH